MLDTSDTQPTWLYHAVEPARVFHLAPGEALPEGWHDAPVASEASEPGSEPSADAGEGSAQLAAALERIAKLDQVITAGTAENARLMAELDEADDKIVQAGEALVKADETIALLKADLVKAQGDGGFAQGELDTAKAHIADLVAQLDAAKAPKGRK